MNYLGSIGNVYEINQNIKINPMRTIKFRAWDKERKEWLSYFEIGKNGAITCYEINETQNLIIQQFTGLKDKNGKEIYEGDILSSLYVDDGCKGLYEVVFENGNFKPRRRKEHQQQYVEVVMSDLERCAIIGNIYENGSLLDK